MHLFDQVNNALQAAHDVCAWMVYAAYDARLGTDSWTEGPMTWTQAEARRQELLGLTPHRAVTVLFDVGQLS